MMVLTITRVSGDNVCYITCITCLHDMTSIRCYYIITCPAWFLSSVPPGCGQCRLRSPAGPSPSGSSSYNIVLLLYCEAQARVRQGSARDGSQGERPQSLNPCQELTLKLIATFHHPPTTRMFNLT